MAVGFLLLGVLKINVKSVILDLLWFVFSVVGICFASQVALEAGPLWYLEPKYLALELLCAFLLVMFIFLITLNYKVSVYFAALLLSLLTVANYFVVRSRGNELTPMDITSIRTAANVTGEYRFTIGPTLFYGMAILGLVLFSAFVFVQNRVGNKLRARIIAALLIAVLAVVWFFGCGSIRISTWAQNGSTFKGYLVNFSAQLIEMIKDKEPEGYTEESVRDLESQYGGETDGAVAVTDPEKQEGASGQESRPDIIVIMDESFVDFRVLGDNFKTEEEVMPFIDSLKENTIRGYALASVFGGGTANSEYECLTGNTMGFMTYGATVYQLYLKTPSFSMAKVLGEKGYRCIATHPYLSSGWSRTKAWPYLGFDEMTFVEAYPQKDYVRDYVSDREMFEYIADLADREKTAPLFLFGVTMQNHGAYVYDGEEYTPSVGLEGYSQSYPDAKQYLGLIRESDKAVEWLIEHFQNVEKDTVILFFGDHFPHLDRNFYSEVHGGGFGTLSEEELQYTVPFFVWTNYDIEEKEIPLTSLNYLSNYVYEAAGMELPPYNQFLLDTEKIIPAVNAKGYYSISCGDFLSFEEISEKASDEEKQALSRYEILEYNSLFDLDNRSKVFFGTEENE